MAIEYEKKITGKTQADGNETIDNDLAPGMTNATRHQVSVNPDTATEGSVAVMMKPYGADDFSELLDDAGDPVVLSIADPEPYLFDGNIDAIRFDPTDVDGTYGVAASGWS